MFASESRVVQLESENQELKTKIAGLQATQNKWYEELKGLRMRFYETGHFNKAYDIEAIMEKFDLTK